MANPEAWIVRRNAERFAGTDRFDALALGDLSDDAVPAIVEALDSLPPEDALILRDELCSAAPRKNVGPFAFNAARAAADDARRRVCSRLSA